MNRHANAWVGDDFLARHSQYRHGSYMAPCADFEMNHVECMEAYGYPRSEIACRMFQEDLLECMTSYKRGIRIHRLRSERVRQVLAGERKFSEYHGTRPFADSYPYIQPR